MRNKKIIAVIQARTGSTRLPGKVLKKIKDKTILNHVVDRVKQAKKVDEVIIATTILSRDDLIVEEANRINCKYYRGSEENVLDRYYNTAKKFKGDIIIRITSDCPLIDPKLIDEMIDFYLNNDYDMVTNAGLDMKKRTYPRGLDTEIFTFELLERAWKKSNQDYQKEHVTLYIYENESNIFFYKNNKDLSQYRLTVDTDLDFKLIKEIYDKLYKGKQNFYMDEIISLMMENPYLYEINKEIKQKEVKKLN